MFVIEESDTEKVNTDGAVLSLLADASDTDGTIGADRISIAAGADGARPHHHKASSEIFYVLDGKLAILLQDRIETVGKGGLVVVPPGTRHAFGAAPQDPIDLLVIATPGVERFAYFRLLPAILRNEFSQEQLDELHTKYDVHFEDSPEWTAARTARHQRGGRCSAWQRRPPA
jgi:mannose-6-phosphate isomerase-like protein (cupin superfamily)